MSISVVCPNGHALQVKEAYAGKTGFCPHCRAAVQVPQPSAREALSEEAILAFLGPHQPSHGRTPGVTEAARVWEQPATAAPAAPKKNCGKCHREIPATEHVCPFCRTYVATAATSSDF